jgi:hypothetical protein
MHPSIQSNYERSLAVLCAAFILCYFYVFTYDGLHTFFTYDDGMALIALHQVFETPFYKNLLQVLQVFTKAFRPMGSLFYRPLYAIFGFDPYPFRVVVHLFLILNIGLLYRLVRNLGGSKESGALAALIVAYNGSMVDLFYNTSTVYDVLCCTFYLSAINVYVRGRSNGEPLSTRRMVWVILFYLAAFDSKEMSVTLPAILLAYEAVYHFREYKNVPVVKRSGGLIAAMLVMAAIYSKVKVSTMASTSAYTPHASSQHILKGLAGYIQQLTLRDPESFSGRHAIIIGIILVGSMLLVRSRASIFGLLYLTLALTPVVLIAPRGGYAAYVAYPGLAIAVGSILAEARSWLVHKLKRPAAELHSAVALFVVMAVFLCHANALARQTGMGHLTWDQSKRIDFFAGLKHTIPEFPPNARVLITEDPWGPDWGPMFLTRLKYHDPDVWLDRTANFDKDKPPNLATYDALIKYQEPALDLVGAKIFGFEMKWETRFPVAKPGVFTVTSSNPNWQNRSIVFTPSAARAGQSVTMTAPGLSNTKVNVVYRVLSHDSSAVHTDMNWCTLDANGTCTIRAPYAGDVGTMVVDWIQPENQRWIFTTGVMTVVE